MNQQEYEKKKQEYEKSVEEFLKFVDREIEIWGIYKNSPELQKTEKDRIIAGLLQLPELQKTIMIPKLIQSKIFTASEIDQAFIIPIEKRKLVTVKELIEADLKPEKMLISGGLIPETDGYALIGGLAKEGKTLLSLQLGLNLISGTNFLDNFKTNKKCKILYIYRENTKQGLDTIIKKQIFGFKKSEINIDLDDLDNFYTYFGKDINLNLKKPDIGELKRSLKTIDPDVIFLDPVSQFIDFELTKAENIKKFTDLLKNIHNRFWILIHHYTKPRFLSRGEKDIAPIYRLLGSSYLANNCETFMGLEREGENYSTDYKRIYFITRREKEPIPLHLKRDPDTLIYENIDSISLMTGKVTGEDIVRVLEISFKGKASYKDLVSLCSDQFGVVEERIAKLMGDLKNKGIIAKEEGKRGRWYIKKLFPDLF